MSAETRKKIPLVYFVCDGGNRLFNHGDILRGVGYEVHCFESHIAALECCEESRLPDIVVTTPFSTTIDTWQFVYLLHKVAEAKNVYIPILILARATVDIATMAICTGLAARNFMIYPIDSEEFLQRVSGFLRTKHPPRTKTVLVYATDELFPEIHRTTLEKAHFEVIRMPFNEPVSSQKLPESSHMILIGAERFDKKLKQNLRSVFQNLPDVPVGVLATNLTQKNTVEIVSMGVSAVIPCPCEPGDLIKSCHDAAIHFLFRRWDSQANLRDREYEDREFLYKKVVESQNDLLCKWLPDTTLTYVNNAFCQILKTNRKNLVGTSISQVIIPDTPKSIETLTRQIIATSQVQTFEHGYIDKSGNTRWHHWTCTPIQSVDGVPVEILAVGRDISDRKRLELNLARNNVELESLLATVPNQFWYLTDPGTYRFANKTHADFLGVSVSQLTDCPIEKIYAPDDVESWRSLGLEVCETRRSITSERMLTSGSGDRRLLAVTETPCLDETGAVLFIVCSARDVTEERMNEFNLAYRAEFEHLISTISSEFVHVDASVAERVITASLEAIAQFTGVDRAYICLEEDQEFSGIPQFFWKTEAAFPMARGIHSAHTWFMKTLSERKAVTISDPAAIPGEAVKEVEYLRVNQIQSLLIIPIDQNRLLAGYIVFEAVHSHIVWEPEIQTLLKFYGEIFLTMLMKTRVWNFIESERDFGLAVNLATSLDELLTICLDYLIAITDMDCGGIYVVNDFEQILELITHKNLSQDFIDGNRSFKNISNHFATAAAGHPVYFDQEKMMTPSHKNKKEEGLRSFAVFPVVFENNLVACVNIASRSRKRMSDFAKAAAETVVSRLGSLIAKTRIEEVIRRNWTNLDTLFNSMNDYLFAVDDQGYIRHANMACQSDLGFLPERLSEMRIQDFYPEEYRNRIVSLMESGTCMTVDGGDAHLLSADGVRIPVDVRFVRGEWQGTPVWFVFNHDVRELKDAEARRIQLERQVQQAQKVESLSRMAGAIAHRFNNLLMGIIGNLELIKMQVGPEHRVTDKLQQAESAAQRATELGRLMLTYVGQVGTNRVQCDLTDVTRRLMPLLTASAPSNVKFEMEFVNDLPLINADVSGIHQIILNLASNSWESFGSEGGLIHLETGFQEITEAFDEPLVENEPLSAGDYVYFAITDNGSGMDKETVDRMFDPFFSTKFTGRGLGLSTVLGIVRAHEGAISVISEKGISTRVTLWFPALKEKKMALQSVFGHEISENFISKVVLLADDEDDVREVARQMLEKLGYSVIEASDGDQALEIFEKNQSQIDYVICDVKMPGRNGWQTMESIRKIRPDVPVILVTGYGLTASEMENLPKPDAMIQKPYRFQNLIKAMDQN